MSLERFELSPSAPEAGTLSIALQGPGNYFTTYVVTIQNHSMGNLKAPVSSGEKTLIAITALVFNFP